ncbi:hypothetical protein C1N91_08635 [Curtobacterium sp. SGAir0471]|nr:hypothetical protein C1N91_08635 [Curtobacterium sp. SGAir0471]
MVGFWSQDLPLTFAADGMPCDLNGSGRHVVQPESPAPGVRSSTADLGTRTSRDAEGPRTGSVRGPQ